METEAKQESQIRQCGQSATAGSCATPAKKVDRLLWGSAAAITVVYVAHLFFADTLLSISWLHTFAHSVFELMNTVWWGLVIGIVMISVLGRVPREFVMRALGTARSGEGGLPGVLRATAAGVLLDLCNHGVLMVGTQLYERGASTGQVIAFLVSSPWNSVSLTLILVALIGLPWTLLFVILSMLVAIVTGLIFESLVRHGRLPGNPNQVDLPPDFRFWREARRQFGDLRLSRAGLLSMLSDGLKSSRMVVRWILFGVVLASLLRALLAPEVFAQYFGPTLMGLAVTLLAATVIEVCSEGSTPIAADILNNAGAPGNGFAFLMGGVATDYTEIMVLRETTASWRLALCLPLITLPQVIILGWLLNAAAG